MAQEIKNIKKLLIEVVEEAGGYASANFKKIKPNQIRYKQPNQKSPVTEVDLQIDTLIKERVWEQFPDHDFITEEREPINNSGDVIWIVDPIDGTSNYIRGNNNYCISVGISIKGELTLGAIYAPELNEFYFAQKNKGLFLNGKKVIPSPKKLNTCFIGSPKYQKFAQQHSILKKYQHIYLGAAALELAKTANGQADAAIYVDIMIWDIAAGMLMIQEVGGLLENFNGHPYNWMDKDLVAYRIKP